MRTNGKYVLLTVEMLLVLLGAALCLGPAFIFAPCAPRADGSWMLCHWAGRTVIALGIVLTALSVSLIAISQPKIKLGLALSLIPLGIVTAIIPGGVMPLCMMRTMRCHLITRPAVLTLGILIAVLALAAVLMLVRKQDGHA